MPDFAWLAHSARMSEHSPVTDLLIIGGGINGCGIARDAAGRGLSVTLVEQDDLASHTSSASTKLIHGGLRYLEYKEFRLVREALAERERLLAIAPHIIWPLRFVLPHGGDMRPAWLLRLGLLIYDNIGGRRRLPGSQSLRFDGTGLGAGLKPGIKRGFAYSDCWVEDSRLVVLNAMDAAERGASIRTRTRLTAAHREAALWHAELLDQATGRTDRITARRLVNAAGPWVASILGSALGQNAHASSRLVKGSHIVVPRLYPGEHAYLLQNTDRRVIFTIPYEQDFTLIGTTDIAFTGDASHVEIEADETRYLCDCVTQWLQTPVTPEDVVWSYSGVRALHDDGAENASAVTRDYLLDLDGDLDKAPLLSVFGGKITTYRRLAEHALDRLGIAGPSWTAKAPLPGGDMQDFSLMLASLQARHRWLPPPLAHRLARAYGTRADRLIGNATSLHDLGEDLGGGLTEAELAYLVAHEFARTPEDVLWRRSKLGLHAPRDTAERLALQKVFA